MAAIVSTRIIRLQAVSPRTAAATLQANINIPAATLIDGVAASTVVDGAADGASALSGLADKLNKAGGDILTGIMDVQVTTNYEAGFRAGSVTWNTTTGAITGGTGVVMTRLGLIGAAAGVTTFSIDVATGAAVFRGDISGASGTFGTGNNVVVLDPSGATYLLWAGHASVSSAPFKLGKNGDLITDKLNVTGTLTATLTGNCSGNAATASDASLLQGNAASAFASASHQHYIWNDLTSSTGRKAQYDTNADFSTASNIYLRWYDW